MDTLQYVTLNNRKITALPFFLKAVIEADRDLKAQGIGLDDQHPGLILGATETSSWRSEVLQKQLLNKGLSKTMTSNHRRGVAIDVYPDIPYVRRIEATMRKHQLVNDLGDWDQVHFNWISNAHSWSYPIINQLPSFLKEFSMEPFEGFIIQLTEPGVACAGAFAFVQGGKKRIVTKNRMAEFAVTILIRLLSGTEHIQSKGLDKKTWDSIPDGEKF